MPTTPEQFRAIKADPEKYALHKARSRAAWKKYAAVKGQIRRAERYFRFRGRGSAQQEEKNARWAGLSVVNAANVNADDTVWRHPGARRESEIQDVTDRFLRGQLTAERAEHYAEILQRKEVTPCQTKKKKSRRSPNPSSS